MQPRRKRFVFHHPLDLNYAGPMSVTHVFACWAESRSPPGTVCFHEITYLPSRAYQRRPPPCYETRANTYPALTSKRMTKRAAIPGGDSIAEREISMVEGFLGLSDVMLGRGAPRRHLRSGDHGSLRWSEGARGGALVCRHLRQEHMTLMRGEKQLDNYN